MSHSTASMLIAETGAELLKALRAPEFIVPTLALPTAFYLLFAVMLSRGGPDAAAFLLATFGVFAVMGPAIFGFGAGVATERERGWLDLKRASPAPGGSYVGAKLLATLAFAAIALMPIYAAAGFLGDVALPRATWALLLGAHLLAVVPFALIGITLGFLLGSNAAIAVANILFLGLSVLGGLWIPIFLFPDVLQTMALALPSYHLAEVALTVVGAERAWSPTAHLAVLALMTAALAALAVFAWSRQR